MYNNCIWKHLLIAHFWKAQTSVFQHYQTGCLTTMVVSYHLGFDLSQLFCLGVQVQLNILCRWMWKQQNLIVYTTNHASKLSVSITSCHSGQLHMYFQHLLQGGSSPRACRHWSAMYYWDMLFCRNKSERGGSDMQVFIPQQTKHCLLSNRWRSDDSFNFSVKIKSCAPFSVPLEPKWLGVRGKSRPRATPLHCVFCSFLALHRYCAMCSTTSEQH